MLLPNKYLFNRRNKELSEYYVETFNEKIRFSIISSILECTYSEELLEYIGNIEREYGCGIPDKRFGDKVAISNFLSTCDDETFITSLEIILLQKYKTVHLYISEKRTNNYYIIFIKNYSKLKEFISKKFEIERIGYEIIDSKIEECPLMIIPIKSTYLHKENIKIARELLYNNNFDGAIKEFDHSLDYYRKGDYTSSITEAIKSYESTMKTILARKQITLDSSKEPKISYLLTKVKEVLKVDPKFNDSFDKMWSILESGPNTIRNLEGSAHGSGENFKSPSKIYNEFVLRTVGTYIVFLIDMYEQNK